MKLARIIGLAVTCAALALGQSKPEPKPAEQPPSKPQTAKPATASEEKEANRKNEGIKVHGHWVLVVKNPDGSVAQRKEFENSLVHTTNGNFSPGDVLLTTLLLGGFQTQSWFLGIFENPAVASPLFFYIQPTGMSCSTTLLCSNSLTVGAGNGYAQIVLTGVTAPAPRSFTISTVNTFVLICTPFVQGNTVACESSPLEYQFTSYGPVSLSVQTGQSVNVTVTISFS
jgi:hypothetical protein